MQKFGLGLHVHFQSVDGLWPWLYPDSRDSGNSDATNRALPKQIWHLRGRSGPQVLNDSGCNCIFTSGRVWQSLTLSKQADGEVERPTRTLIHERASLDEIARWEPSQCLWYHGDISIGELNIHLRNMLAAWDNWHLICRLARIKHIKHVRNFGLSMICEGVQHKAE